MTIKNEFDEGASIGQVNGMLTPEAAEEIKKHQLIDGKQYSCEICGKTFTAPEVSRCICGLRICNKCSYEHENGW